jgi:hypothetical protein
MSIEDDAKTIVDLIRAQDHRGRLMVDQVAAVRLVATALRVAEDRGVINGFDRMGDIAQKHLVA